MNGYDDQNNEVLWEYNDGSVHGPYTRLQIYDLIQSGVITETTLIRSAGELRWLQVSGTVFGQFVPRRTAQKKPYRIADASVSIILSVINFIVFLAETIAGGSQNVETAIRFGALYVPFVKTGEYYRLFTAIFLHFGLTHLLVNTFSLGNIGPLVEKIFGKIRFLIIYLVSGIAGNVLICILEGFTGQYHVSAGASGAVFGILGAYLGMSLSREYRQLFNIRRILLAIVIALAPGLYMQGISLTAHVGGLIGGTAVSLILMNAFPKHH